MTQEINSSKNSRNSTLGTHLKDSWNSLKSLHIWEHTIVFFLFQIPQVPIGIEIFYDSTMGTCSKCRFEKCLNSCVTLIVRIEEEKIGNLEGPTFLGCYVAVGCGMIYALTPIPFVGWSGGLFQCIRNRPLYHSQSTRTRIESLKPIQQVPPPPSLC